MVIVYNNFLRLRLFMNTITLLHESHEVGENPTPQNFFPRIIREFEDNDEPMIYGYRS